MHSVGGRVAKSLDSRVSTADGARLGYSRLHGSELAVIIAAAGCNGDIGGVINIRPDRKGAATLRIYALWLNHTPSWQVADSLRSGMDQVYASLQERLPGMPPATDVEEQLIGFPKR